MRPTNLDDTHVHMVRRRGEKGILCDPSRLFGSLWEDPDGSHISRAGSGDKPTNFRFTFAKIHVTCPKCCLQLGWSPTDMDGLEEVVKCVQRARQALGCGQMPLMRDRELLLAYIDRLETNATRAENDSAEEGATRERLSELLTGVANAFKGPPPELTLWSWHDLPSLAEKAVEVVKAAKEQNRCDCSTRVAVLSDGTCAVCLTVDTFEKAAANA
jgi:hypothetical protein